MVYYMEYGVIKQHKFRIISWLILTRPHKTKKINQREKLENMKYNINIFRFNRRAIRPFLEELINIKSCINNNIINY